MFLPLYPKGPIYHWPIATALLILANVLGFAWQMAVPPKSKAMKIPLSELRDDPELAAEYAELELEELTFVAPVEGWYDYALSHGDGLHPIQWLTSNFMHGSAGHLLGNMLFLYIFGMLLEGRVGSVTFALLYVSMGVSQCALEQILCLGSPSAPSYGASSAIYAIMALAMIWMPKVEIQCLYTILFRPILFDLPALIFGMLYVFWDFGIALFSNFTMSTALLHVSGAAVGLVAAFVGLKLRWVDTENADLYSLIQEAAGKELPDKPKRLSVLEQQAEKAEQAELKEKIAAIRRSIEMHLNAGNYQAAIGQMREWKRRDASAQWTEPQLRSLFTLAFKAKDSKTVEEIARQYIERFDEPFADQVRLVLGKQLVVEQKHPRKALKVLEPIVESRLPPKHREQYQQLLEFCRKQANADDFELD
ncbi:MAG: rhomboid family intramembrane serine protease [Planctomycetota bacterium]